MFTGMLNHTAVHRTVKIVELLNLFYHVCSTADSVSCPERKQEQIKIKKISNNNNINNDKKKKQTA